MSMETLRRLVSYNDEMDDATDKWACEMAAARDRKLEGQELQAATDAFFEQCKIRIFNGATNFRRGRNDQLTFDCRLPQAVDAVIPEIVIDAVIERFQSIGFGVTHSCNDGIPFYDNLVFGLPPDWVQRLTSLAKENK